MASRLLVPRDQFSHRPTNAAQSVAHAAVLATRVGRSVTEDDRPLAAYVNHGRWVADCPHCNSGIAIHPEWSSAVCLGMGCYRVFRTVVLPDEWRQIESVLSERPLANQNWLSSSVRTKWSGGLVTLPDETVDALIAENLERGLKAGR